MTNYFTSYDDAKKGLEEIDEVIKGNDEKIEKAKSLIGRGIVLTLILVLYSVAYKLIRESIPDEVYYSSATLVWGFVIASKIRPILGICFLFFGLILPTGGLRELKLFMPGGQNTVGTIAVEGIRSLSLILGVVGGAPLLGIALWGLALLILFLWLGNAFLSFPIFYIILYLFRRKSIGKNLLDARKTAEDEVAYWESYESHE